MKLEWLLKVRKVCNVESYFKKLFSNNYAKYSGGLSHVSIIISSEQNIELTRSFVIVEFMQALFQMHSNKGPILEDLDFL